MPLCPNGQNPVIEWQYPGGEKTRITGADNYTIENVVPNFTGGQCPKDYYVWCKWDGQRKIGRLIRGKITSVECGVYPDFLGRPRNYGISVKNDQGIQANGSNFNTVVQNLSSNQIEIVPNVGLDDCGDKPSKCTFKVFKDGNIVYQKTDTVCPTVDVICDEQECPPNTCECINGSTVCCYDPNTGRVVETFMR